jgi:histidine decarboxylase
MKNKIESSISPYDNYCDGYGNSESSGNSYLLGLSVSVGITKKMLNHPGSQMLDEINAFDIAETKGPYIGQLNMSTVSSFCGPQGQIWGLDVVKHPKLEEKEDLLYKKIEYRGKVLSIYDGKFIVDATEKLFGNVNDKKFILRPGAHVPFANKNIKMQGPKTIYAAMGIGIPSDRERHACLLMEDVGTIEGEDINDSLDIIKTNLGKSIIEIGYNQKVEYTECYVVVSYGNVKEGEIGCALVAAPYFTLAKNALPKNENNTINYERFLTMNLIQWEKEIIYGNISSTQSGN